MLFLFIWQLVLPLTTCVFAYGRILLVLRRQGKGNPGQRRTITVATTTNEPVAGPSNATTQVTNIRLTSGTTQKDKGEKESKVKAVTSSQSQGGQNLSTGMSKAKVNVIRTMILIFLCFVVCFSPNDVYAFYRPWTVFIYLLTMHALSFYVKLEMRIACSAPQCHPLAGSSET